MVIPNQRTNKYSRKYEIRTVINDNNENVNYSQQHWYVTISIVRTVLKKIKIAILQLYLLEKKEKYVFDVRYKLVGRFKKRFDFDGFFIGFYWIIRITGKWSCLPVAFDDLCRSIANKMYSLVRVTFDHSEERNAYNVRVSRRKIYEHKC